MDDLLLKDSTDAQIIEEILRRPDLRKKLLLDDELFNRLTPKEVIDHLTSMRTFTGVVIRRSNEGLDISTPFNQQKEVTIGILTQALEAVDN